MLHLHEGPELTTHCRKNREEKKAQHPAGFEPTTLRVLLSRHVLHRCATTIALRGALNLKILSISSS